MRSIVLVFLILFRIVYALEIKSQESLEPFYDSFWNLGPTTIDFTGDSTQVFQNDNFSYFALECLSHWYDPFGELYYATNGITVVDSQGSLVNNGDSLSYHESTFDSWRSSGLVGPGNTIILPGFQDVNETTIFHLLFRLSTPDTLGINSFYDELLTTDANLNTDFIEISNKNRDVFSGTLDQGVSAVRHSNGRDWWINLNSRIDNEQYLLIYSPDSIKHVSTQLFEPRNIFAGLGQSIFSPRGSKFVKSKLKMVTADSVEATILIYDFDRCSGELKHVVNIAYPINFVFPIMGVAISPNERFLYASIGTYLIQYDLLSINIEQSGVILFNLLDDPSNDGTGLWMMQLGPDGCIYINTQGSSKFIHTIEKPNLPGFNCDFRYKSIETENFVQPALPNTPSYRATVDVNSPCDTLGIAPPPLLAAFEYLLEDSTLTVDFFDSSSLHATDYYWNFGDANASDERFPSHTYQVADTYTVCLTVSVTGSPPSTACKEIVFDPITSTSDVTNTESLKVKAYPVPARDLLNIELAASGNYRMTLTDVSGRKLKEREIINGRSGSINTDTLPAGSYVLEIRDLTRGLVTHSIVTLF